MNAKRLINHFRGARVTYFNLTNADNDDVFNSVWLKIIAISKTLCMFIVVENIEHFRLIFILFIYKY